MLLTCTQAPCGAPRVIWLQEAAPAARRLPVPPARVTGGPVAAPSPWQQLSGEDRLPASLCQGGARRGLVRIVPFSLFSLCVTLTKIIFEVLAIFLPGTGRNQDVPRVCQRKSRCLRRWPLCLQWPWPVGLATALPTFPSGRCSMPWLLAIEQRRGFPLKDKATFGPKIFSTWKSDLIFHVPCFKKNPKISCRIKEREGRKTNAHQAIWEIVPHVCNYLA